MLFSRSFLIICCGFLFTHVKIFAQQPVAEFTSDINAGCFPITVNFTDLSTNSPDSFFWDFGNSNTSVLQNPSAVYSSPGNYTVLLIACNSNGCDTIIKNNFIRVFDYPAADFTSDVTYGCAPLTVQFSDLSVTTSAPIGSWYWDFGDGNFSTAQNPSYTYMNPGFFSVSIAVTDTNGCNSSKFMSGYISLSNPPVLSFAANPSSSCYPPLAVNFTNTTTQGTYPIQSWYWDFGDGFNSSATSPQHTFTGYGSYNVSLTATDTVGCSVTRTDTGKVQIGADTADFIYTLTRTCASLNASFSGSATGSISNWLFDFGDGTPDGNGQNVTHSFTSSGQFQVTLIATNDNGCNDTVIKTISYLKVQAGFYPDTNVACSTPFTVNFTNTTTGTPPFSWQWDFSYEPQDGFNQQSVFQNPSYTYFTNDTFDVMLIATDSFGCRDTITLKDMNDSIWFLGANAWFQRIPADGCYPLTVDFTDVSSAGIGVITSWSWNFDDPASGINNISALQNPSHTFNDDDIYFVKLVITTDSGCTDSVTISVSAGYPPTVDTLNKTKSVACHGEAVSFTVVSSDPVNDGYWDWGDGSFSNGGPPAIHSFQDTGTLIIRFTPMYNGCPGPDVFDTIVILPPKPIFTANPTFICRTPATVTFTNFSWDADSWYWDFDDGTPVDISWDAVHTYNTPGLYDPRLVVVNGNGCRDSLYAQIRIPQPTAVFAANPTGGCVPFVTSFSQSSFTYLPLYSNIVSWNWNFGDGTNSSQQIPPPHTYFTMDTFTVTLIVTDNYGCKDTLIKTDYIKTYGNQANFTGTPVSGCAPLDVTFTDQSTSSSVVISWNWSFGDGSPAGTTQNPLHTYSNPGNYNVSLGVTDANGCTTNMTKTGFLLVTKPLAQYTHPVQVCLNENVVFSNTSSGLGITYLWNFGDGDTSSQRDVIHYYSDTGTFNITLLITDTVGCTDTGISSIRVKPLPVAAFTVDSIFTKCPPLVVKFTDLSTIDNDTINAWKWDFGDGVQNYVQNPVHTFSYPDTFDISLIVTSSTGCRDTLMIPDMVTVKGPVGTFTFDPDSGCFPLTVDFSSVTSLVDEYTWDFGDGVIDTVSGPTAVHTYPIPGFPFPQLSITDSLGCKLPATPPVPPYIPIDQVVVDFAVAPQTLWTPFCPPDTNWFYDSSYVINDSSVIVGWQWDFGDGFYDSVQNPWHVYSDTGTFLATLTATSSLGCTNSINRTIKIILNDTLVLNATDGGSIQVSCFGYNDGEATVSQQGGTAPFTYLWSASAGSQITATATGLYSGNHKVTITDTWGCKDSITITVNTPALLTATATATAVACYADSSASAFASASGGTPPYDFQWSSGQLAVNSLQSIIDSIPAGIYIVTITDSLGCDTIASVTVTEPPQLTATITVNAALCFGDYSGSAFATASGGTPPYDFLWSNGKWTIDSLESTIENIQAGVYGVTVTDSLGCDTIGSDTVTEPTLLTATATAAAALCFGDSSASAFASASGGTPPYDFLWSNGEWTVDSLQSIIDTITAGIYSVTVTDSSGCDTNASVVITEPPVLSFSVTQTNVSCNGGSDGTATATCAGGSGTYTYLWNDPPPAQATQTVTGLTAGTWSITITDSLGCDTTADVLITEPAVLSIIFTQTNVSCTGGNDATATAQVTGGSGNYTCVWDTPPPVQNSQTATGLTAGTWNVTVTDSLGCDTSAPVSITEPMPVTAVTAETDVSCYGGSDGTALVTVTGGSGTYTYVWNDPPPVQTDSVATGLSAGTWSVTITDSLGCDTIVTVTITAPPLLTATVSVIMNVSCYGGNTGEATANPSGGSGAYSYLWNDPPPVQIIQTATGLPAGTWFVTVTDSLGCDTIVSVIITEPPVLAFTVTQTDVSCNGGSDGSATAAVTGGTGTYSFVWNDPPPVQVTATATGLSAGTWSVTITDSLGCDTVAGVIITEPAILTITVTQTDVSCEGGNDGTATAQVTGGSGNYTYSWDDPPPIQISQTATGLTAGTWNVTVSDSLGCDTTASVTVTEPPVLTATATATATLCFGDSSASAFASASGGTPPYDFQWSSGQWAVDSLQSTVGNLQEGTYYVTITDSLGCDTTASVVVTEPALLTATAAATAVTCYGDSSASATASASGGTPPYDFQWSNGQWTMNSLQSLIDSISAGIYTVTVTDSNNCVAYDTITVSDYSQLNITFDINGSADSVGCYGVPSTVTAVTTGSAPPYTYSWSDGSVFITGNPISVTPYWVQTWTVTVTDSAGCTTAEAVNLYVNFLLVNVTTDDTVCTGESVTVEALTTGTLPWINPSYNYIWNTSATTPSVNVVINSVSTFMVTVSDGCSRPGSDTITIIPYANPGIGINVNSTAGCPPFEVVFSDTVDDIPGSQHIWYFSDGGWITGNPAVYSFNNTGYFFTSLTVTSPEGCSSSALFTDTITVYALPTAYFTADPVITKINDPIVNFTNLSSVNPFIQDTIAGYLWDFTDGDTSYAINPSHSFRDTGTFNVVLTVITQYGCTAQYSFAVRIDPFIEIRIPSAFTPNAAGSSGGVYDPLSYDNDVFYPITKYVAEYLFQIFNRWGELIFESTDHAVGWDGYYRSKLCQQDTYMWKLKLKWTTGEEYFKVGSVLLVR